MRIGVVGLILCLALGSGCGDEPAAAGPSTPVGATAVRGAPPSIALGDLSALTPPVRRAFESHPDDFPGLRVAEPGDWLTLHTEEPQSVANYQLSEPNRPGEQGRDTLYILPLGPVPDLSELKAFAGDYFTIPVVILPVADLQGEAFTRRSRGSYEQVLATDLQAYLQAHLPDDAYALIGLTSEDLYPTADYNYVFGLASTSKRTGVFSFARYDPRFYDPQADPNPTLQRTRAFKILAHEVGHMFGMGHCVHHACLMNGANHSDELDRAPLALCPVCLRKLHIATGFDPKARYESLAQRYAEAELDAAAGFVRTRISRIDAD